MNASITASKEELDYQLQYPGKNKVIKEYANIRNFYSWGDEKDTVNTLTSNSYISPTIYDLRTPMKKGNQKKQTMKKLSCRLINLQISKATKRNGQKTDYFISQLHLYRIQLLMISLHVLRALLLMSCIATITLQTILDIKFQSFNTEYK
jgi:hypothetical protein